MNKYLIYFFILHSINCYTQTVFYQDIISGGVTVGGVSTGLAFNYQNAEITVDLSQSDSISKAFLIYYSSVNFPFDSLNFNGDNYFENDNYTISTYEVPFSNGETDNLRINFIDVTQSVNSLQNNYSFSIDNSNFDIINSFLLYVVYYKSESITTSTTLIVNNQDLTSENIYNFYNINKHNLSSPLALSLHTDILWDTITDGSYVYVNDNYIGLIGGSDINNSQYIGAGVTGSYNYIDGILNGLSDDTSDSLMAGSDGLANVSTYSSNSQINLKFTTQSPNNIYNNYISFNIAYSTPCQPQNVTITPDTTICPNTSLALSASGGIAYEWLPEVGLSCYDCPNPVFSGDSSRLYTVRIWGSDSCSVVRPVMIHVRKQPKTTFYNQTTTLCGEAQALINWQTAGNNSYSLNDGVFQSTGVFNQVAAGNQLLTVRDAFGCRFDTLVAIDSYLVVDAGLLVSPTSGVAPLEIQIANQSTNFTDWSWRVNNAFQSNVNSTFQAVTSGNYEIELIAWQNDSTCADTAVQNVFISETGFYIFGSSIVAASSASQNAFLVYTNGKPKIDISIYDAQGRLLKTKTTIQLTEGANAIWNSSEMAAIASEVIFYKINWNTAGDSGELEGKALVLR